MNELNCPEDAFKRTLLMNAVVVSDTTNTHEKDQREGNSESTFNSEVQSIMSARTTHENRKDVDSYVSFIWPDNAHIVRTSSSPTTSSTFNVHEYHRSRVPFMDPIPG